MLEENTAHDVEVLTSFHFFILKLTYYRHCEVVRDGDLSWIATQHNVSDFSGSDKDPNTVFQDVSYLI